MFKKILLIKFVFLYINCSRGVQSALESDIISKEISTIESESESSPSTIQHFQISQSWSQEPGGYIRKVFYKYPQNGNRIHPVAIVLHGNGGRANEFINEFSYLTNHIIVAPQGYEFSWNIGKESSKAPDLNFIYKIINHLDKLENIDKGEISIIGSSNGAAFINQLLIELKIEGFKTAICLFSQLNTLQYREESFWSRTDVSTQEYDIKMTPPTDRKILSFAGTEDLVCPYYGGIGVLDYNFLNTEDVAFIWANAMGYKGNQIKAPSLEYENIYRFSYLEGHVVHYKLEGAGHGFDPFFEIPKNIIKNFIEN